MKIPKITLAQFAIIVTIIGSFAGWYFTYTSKENERKKSDAEAKQRHDQEIIYQHDQEKSFDSLRTAVIIFFHDFQELRKNREVTLKQNADRDKANDERDDKQELDINTLKVKIEDHLFYNHKK